MTTHFMPKGEKPPSPHMTYREERGKFISTKGEAPMQVRAHQGFLIQNRYQEPEHVECYSSRA